MALSGVVPLLLWTFNAPARQPEAQAIVTGVLIAAGIGFSLVLGRRDRRPHEMIVWLFTYLFLGVAPIIQLQSNWPGTTPGISSQGAAAAATIVLVGIAFFAVGLWIATRRETTATFQTPKPPREVEPLRVYLLTFGTLALAALYIAAVGPSNLFAARADLGAARAESIGGPFGVLFVAGAKMGLLVAFIALVQLWRQRRMAGRPGPWFATVVVLVTLLTVVNPISSARYVFGTVALAVLAALGVFSTIRRFRLLSIGALVGIVVIFPILDTFRRTLDATVELESPLESLATADFDAFGQIMNAYYYVSAQGVVWGKQLLGVAFFWVPRDLWPSKPTDTGVMLADFQGYRFRNLSAPLWAEFFVNFGWVGLAVGMVAFGYIIRRLDQRSENMLLDYGIPGVAASVIPFYLLIVLRGSLLQAMSNLLIIVAGAWLVSRRTDPSSKLGTAQVRELTRTSRGRT